MLGSNMWTANCSISNMIVGRNIQHFKSKLRGLSVDYAGACKMI